MNSDTLIEMLQKGFRVTLGATTSLVEVVQDSEHRTENLNRLQQECTQTATSIVEAIQNPQKREENLNRLRQEWGQLSEEWVVKGEATEQEARSFVDTWLTQRSNSPSSSSSGSTKTAAGPTVSPEVQTELQDLINQIATIRTELENERKSNQSDQ